jgi:hypothetical protein
MYKYVLAVIAVFIQLKCFSQCSYTISSSNGYNVIVKVLPSSIIPSTTNCPYGYNYNAVINYSVTFTGSNIPSSLYTLQGNLTCGSQSLFYDLPNNGGIGSYTTSSNPYISSDGNNIYTTHPNCRAANPSNLNCNSVSIQINGPGITNQTINCSTAVPLPIQLVYFSGSSLANGITLNWQTLTEKNNERFEIEKSVNGINWQVLENIAGSGTSVQLKNYSFLDLKALNGVNYYRLKQIDFDGQFKYSEIIYVFHSFEKPFCSVVWPNPFHSKFNFEIQASEPGKAVYRLFNELGIITQEKSLSYYKGKSEIEITIDDDRKGFYLLEIIFDDENKVHRKILKL